MKTTKPHKTIKPLRILSAEDDIHMQHVILLALTDCGHSVAIASDGVQALAMVVADIHAFDIIITDHQMPNLDGLGFVRGLRLTAYSGKIIVFCSALSSEDQHAYRKLSVDRFLSKPITHKLLVENIEKIYHQ